MNSNNTNNTSPKPGVGLWGNYNAPTTTPLTFKNLIKECWEEAYDKTTDLSDQKLSELIQHAKVDATSDKMDEILDEIKQGCEAGDAIGQEWRSLVREFLFGTISEADEKTLDDKIKPLIKNVSRRYENNTASPESVASGISGTSYTRAKGDKHKYLPDGLPRQRRGPDEG